MAAQLSSEIDQLLEQYLQLLDTYTTLRADLSAAQASIHQHIARANFSADRGVRYGEPLYDARMRASRGCRVGGTKVEVLPTGTGEEEEEEEEPDQDTADAKGTPDALRMFGILVPPELRMARGEAVALVEDLVPRLVMTDLEMRDVEVRIRRARKWMAKAEAKGEGKGLERRGESLAASSDAH